mmetsp:Transcript_13088/g.22089  ORF Transcript_13088/g.22089 Transcript_13088/m.22089 type:complete len:170 (+) Transcript_13088:55-564(+)
MVNAPQKAEPLPKRDASKVKNHRFASVPLLGFLSELMTTYNSSFVLLLGFQYFNQGSKAILNLAVKDYFKTYLNLEPSYMAQIQSFIAFPWSIKLLYGLVSDNVPILGSKRRSYVIVMGAFQFLSLLALYLFDIQNEKVIALLLFFSALSGAYLDVLVDALMVVQSRQD